MGTFLKVGLILWKNLIIKKRHWLLTSIETALPILLFTAVAFARSEVNEIKKIVVDKPTIHPVIGLKDIYSHLVVQDLTLLYAPFNDGTEAIIKGVQRKLRIRGEAVQYFDNKEEVLQAFQNTTSTVAVIIFNNVDYTKSLDYDLTLYSNYFSWKTTELYTETTTSLNSSLPDYIERGYAALQLAIDFSFIETCNQTLKLDSVNFNMQQFPDPPRVIDSGQELFRRYLPVVTMFSFLCMCLSLIQKVSEEKASGIKEYMKMVGIKSWMLWFGWFLESLVFNLLSVGIIVILMKTKCFGAPYPPIEFCDGTVLFVFLALYSMTVVTYCFFIATIFNRPSIGAMFGVLIWIMSYFLPVIMIEINQKMSWIWKIIFCVFPNVNLYYGYASLSTYEMREIGQQWNNVFLSGTGCNNEITMAQVFILFSIEIFAFFILSIYLENIKPGKYGIPKRFYYPVTNLVKFFKNSLKNKIQQEDEEQGRFLENYIEVKSLSKRYRDHLAVDDLSMDIKKNSVTVLLGENGAGKTTFLSILTGVINATSGTVTVNNKDIKQDTDEVRKMYGLCTQHDLLFSNLTVKQHLYFFGKVKGSTKIDEECHEILELLQLEDKKDELPDVLSGGMKRKLCLGIALVGNPEILILDEPTAGMDPESRRFVWNQLAKEKKEKGKTIIVSTHFMEEAEAVGEKIVIMSNGILQCHDTIANLKSKYKTGYQLSLKLSKTTYLEHITNIVQMEFPESSILRHTDDGYVVYLLPFNKLKTKYQNLVRILEKRLADGSIESIDLDETTLTDVYLKATFYRDKTSPLGDTLQLLQNPPRIITGFKRSTSIIWSLLLKRWYFLQKRYYWYISTTVVTFSIILLAMLLPVLKTKIYKTDPPIVYNLDLYGSPDVYHNNKTLKKVLHGIADFYRESVIKQKGKPIPSENVINAILEKGKQNIEFFRKNMVTAEQFYNDQDLTVFNTLFSMETLHSVPIAINIATNAILKSIFNETNYIIKITNTPLSPIANHAMAMQLSTMEVSILWTILISTGLIVFGVSFIIFPNHEVTTGFFHIQKISGVKNWMYWFINIIFDLITIMPLTILFISFSLLDSLVLNLTAFEYEDYYALFTIFGYYIIISIPFTYQFSFKKTISSGFSLFFTLGLLGMILMLTSEAVKFSQKEKSDIIKYVEYGFATISPQLALNKLIFNFSQQFVNNYNWKNMEPKKRESLCTVISNPCCYGETSSECKEHQSYFRNKDFGIGEDLAFMWGAIVVYSITVTSINSDIFDFWKKDKVVKTKETSFQVQDLEKTLKKNKVLQKLSFKLKEKLCLGILGPNGAGKSTMFKVLARLLRADNGEIKIPDATAKKEKPLNIENYFDKIGYCPQENCLNYVLTGRELIRTIARNRGIKNVEDYTTEMLKIFELEEIADKSCIKYSGGNKRKLCVCLAVLGQPTVVLLDEPTSGVDPSSRLQFWKILRKMKKMTNFLLCSHSMEETENVCDEIALLKEGYCEEQLNPDSLKIKHQKGYKVCFSLEDKTDTNETISWLNADIASAFKYMSISARPLDVTKDQIVYEVDQQLRLSVLLEKLRQIQDQFELIKDFSLKRITLEDIFLNDKVKTALSF